MFFRRCGINNRIIHLNSMLLIDTRHNKPVNANFSNHLINFSLSAEKFILQFVLLNLSILIQIGISNIEVTLLQFLGYLLDQLFVPVLVVLKEGVVKIHQFFDNRLELFRPLTLQEDIFLVFYHVADELEDHRLMFVTNFVSFIELIDCRVAK